MLARPTAFARSVAATEVELLGKALLDQVIDGGMERVESAKLFALELGKRSINSRNSRRHCSSVSGHPTCPTSGYKLNENSLRTKFLFSDRANRFANKPG